MRGARVRLAAEPGGETGNLKVNDSTTPATWIRAWPCHPAPRRASPSRRRTTGGVTPELPCGVVPRDARDGNASPRTSRMGKRSPRRNRATGAQAHGCASASR